MFKTMKRIVLGIIFISIMSMQASAGWWEESSLTTRPEGTTEEGVNDSLLTASEDMLLDSLPNSGTGTIANNSDDDWYKLSGYSGTHQFLKITTDGTRANLRLRNASYDYLATGDEASPLYYYLPSTATDLYLEVNRGGDSTYRLIMEVVDAATISGQIRLVGLTNSTSNSLTVYAFNMERHELAQAEVTDPDGHYSIFVPAGMEVGGMGAERDQYDYMLPPPYPEDWFYGESVHILQTPITLAGGMSISDIDFDVFPEAQITGSITSGVDVEIQLVGVYTGGEASHVSNTQNAFHFRNVFPGTYDLIVSPQASSGYAPQRVTNVRPVDGQTLNIDIALTTGYTVSGNITPAVSSPTELHLDWYGNGQLGGDEAYDGYFTQAITPSDTSFVFNNVPNGTYELVMGNEGPSSYPVIPITVNNGNVTNAHFTTNFDATIGGTVTDNSGQFVDLTQLMIVGVARGQTAVGYTAMHFAPVLNAGGDFVMSVPDTALYYDVSVASFSMESAILGRTYDCVTGAANVSITIEPNGNSLSGDIAHSSGKVLNAFLDNAPLLTMFRTVKGHARLMDMVVEANDAYTTVPFLDGIPNTPYAMSVKGFSDFMEDTTQDIIMTGSNQTVDITFQTDTTKDRTSPAVFQLEPVHRSVTTNARPIIHALLWDNFLGSGVDTASLNVLMNGSSVSPSIVPMQQGQYGISFQPGSDLIPANNPQEVLMTVGDHSTNPQAVPTAVVTWSFDIATYTATPTPTVSATITSTQTQTPDYSPTPSPTISSTPTISATATISATETSSPTASPTGTRSATATSTSTATLTLTITPSGTITSTATVTPTMTMTSTITPTMTASATNALSGIDLNGRAVLSYPNPGKENIRFLLHLEEATTVKIALYNLNGEQVGEIEQRLGSGRGQYVQWNCEQVATGIYLARVYMNGKVADVLKVAVVK